MARRLLRYLLLPLVMVGSLFAVPTPAHAAGTRFDCLAHYESTNRWHINTHNGYYGGLQFTKQTWRAFGGVHTTHRVMPNRASRRGQIKIARRVAWYGWRKHHAQGGRNAWPATWGRCF